MQTKLLHWLLQGISEPVKQLVKSFYSASDPPTSYELWGEFLQDCLQDFMQSCLQECMQDCLLNMTQVKVMFACVS
jgi:hypothetical protein